MRPVSVGLVAQSLAAILWAHRVQNEPALLALVDESMTTTRTLPPHCYAYHGTKHLKAIVRMQQLIPQDVDYGEPRLHFHADVLRALDYGPYVLRFEWPRDAILSDGVDWCSDHEWYLRRPVPIEDLEIWEHCWEYLTDFIAREKRLPKPLRLRK
jgi:hypothetical protein